MATIIKLIDYRHPRSEEIPIHLDVTRAPPEPFGIESDCTDPAGHYQIRYAMQVVCAHCARIFWP